MAPPSRHADVDDRPPGGDGGQVLEIGTGHGYQTALLAQLAARVVSIEVRRHFRRLALCRGPASTATLVGQLRAGTSSCPTGLAGSTKWCSGSGGRKA